MIHRNIVRCGRWVHFTTTPEESGVFRVQNKDYMSWWDGNTYRPTGFLVGGIKPMPKRFALTGKKGPNIVDGDGYSKEADDEEQDGYHRFRYEVHPNEMAEIIARYSPPNSVVCDTTAGCLGTAMACLRLSRFCIVGEQQTEGDMLDNAWERLRQCYAFLKADGLLPEFGRPLAKPTWWERQGQTWLHRAQYWQLQADKKDKRRIEKQERDQLIRKQEIEQVRRLPVAWQLVVLVMLCCVP